jgi:hypothetical protein
MGKEDSKKSHSHKSEKSSKDKKEDKKDHKEHKHSSRKEEKKDKKEHKHKDDKERDNKERDGGEVDDGRPKISVDDYFTKSEEFRVWLKLAKGEFFEDLSSKDARKIFEKDFVKDFNKGRLSAMFYDGMTVWRYEGAVSICNMSYVMSYVICHMSYVVCRMSYVICHMSYVICHMSYVICRCRMAYGIYGILYHLGRSLNAVLSNALLLSPPSPHPSLSGNIPLDIRAAATKSQHKWGIKMSKKETEQVGHMSYGSSGKAISHTPHAIRHIPYAICHTPYAIRHILYPLTRRCFLTPYTLHHTLYTLQLSDLVEDVDHQTRASAPAPAPTSSISMSSSTQHKVPFRR